MWNKKIWCTLISSLWASSSKSSFNPFTLSLSSSTSCNLIHWNIYWEAIHRNIKRQSIEIYRGLKHIEAINSPPTLLRSAAYSSLNRLPSFLRSSIGPDLVSKDISKWKAKSCFNDGFFQNGPEVGFCRCSLEQVGQWCFSQEQAVSQDLTNFKIRNRGCKDKSQK